MHKLGQQESSLSFVEPFLLFICLNFCFDIGEWWEMDNLYLLPELKDEIKTIRFIWFELMALINYDLD